MRVSYGKTWGVQLATWRHFLVGVAVTDMKRRGNPNWGKMGPVMPAVPTQFEDEVRRLKLRPDEYVDSRKLRQWAYRYRNSNYVPEALLKAWGLDVYSLRDVWSET